MSLVSRPLPGLFGGVSQQIPAMRHPTHCSVQDNGFSTLVDGLYKRPGTQRIRTLDLTGDLGASVQGSYGAAYGHVIDKGSSGRYQLILGNGNFMLYDLATGTAQSVLAPYGRSYLATSSPETDFRCVTVADYTFIVNKSKTVAMLSTVTAVNPTNIAHVNVKTAVPNVAYNVTVDSSFVSITTGDTPTNASIATALRNAIATAKPTYTVTVIANSNIVRILRPSGTITVSASDGWGNQALQYITGGVDKFSDLPAQFEMNYVLTINGSADKADDKYYVRWTGTRWQETAQPGIATSLDPTTMPHQLRPDGAGGWIFEPATWAPLECGDDNTNPQPSFVGRGIRGAFFHRNRLGFLAGDSLVLSRAGTYFNFWASTATQAVATDPIDLDAPAEDVDTLDWAVPFNESLLVWGSNKKQFVLSGGDILSPDTARLTPTTSFEVDSDVKPVSLGNRALFSTAVGSASQLNLYRLSEDTVTNHADDLTAHAPSYVAAGPRKLVASTAVKMAVVLPRGASKVIPVFKYELDGEQMSQLAWQQIILPTTDTVRVMDAHWVSRTLYLLLHVTSPSDPVAGGRFVLEKIDVDRAAFDTGTNIGLRLDSRVLATVGAYDAEANTTLLTVPYMLPGQLTFLKVVGGSEPELLTVVSATADTTTLSTRTYVQGNLTGATVWAGVPFMFRYVFSPAVERDAKGSPVMNATVKLAKYLISYVKTGWFTAKVAIALRSTYEYQFNGRTIGQPGQGPSQLSLSDGEFAIPVQAKASSATVSIESDSYLPVNIPYAEWKGDITLKAQR